MSKKKDPRVIRTRRLLRDALIELVVEKGYDKVTVQDITDRATLNRATIYLHYQDKDALLYDCAKELFEDVWSRMQIDGRIDELLNPATAIPMEIVVPAFEHFAEYANFYRVVLGKNGVPAFAEIVRHYYSTIIRDLLTQHIKNPDPILLDSIVHFNASGILGMVTWWLQNDMPYSPEIMSRYLLEVLGQGLLHFIRQPGKREEKHETR